MKSPRTDYEFKIDPVGLKTACELTWPNTPEVFVDMVRMCFGLPIEGPPPMWHFLEIMRILKERGTE